MSMMTPIERRGVWFPSISEASRQIGVSRCTLIRYLDRGNVDAAGSVPYRPAQPCDFDGVEYASLAAASRALGITPQGVRYRLAQRQAKQVAA